MPDSICSVGDIEGPVRLLCAALDFIHRKNLVHGNLNSDDVMLQDDGTLKILQLGIGLPITEPSLGLLIANGFQYLMSGAMRGCAGMRSARAAASTSCHR